MEENSLPPENAALNPTEPLVPPIKSPRKFNTKLVLLFTSMVLIILFVGGGLIIGSKNMMKKPAPSSTPVPTVSPSASVSASPSVSPASSFIPKIVATISPSPTPKTTGNISILFFKDRADTSDNSTDKTPDGVTSQIHVNGSVVADYTGNPNWSMDVAPGSYDASGTLPGYSFESEESSQGVDSLNPFTMCDGRFTVKAGETYRLSCWFKKN